MRKSLVSLFLVCFTFSYSQKFDIDTILLSGPIHSRINLVMLGDGYQANELSQFAHDADIFVENLFFFSPYKEYKNYFNAFIIKVPSNESGASHPGTAVDEIEPVHPVSEVDNYFGSSFDSYYIHRLLFAHNVTAINNVLASNFPAYDQVMILVNSPYYGGSGGEFPVASLHENSFSIAIHELGHSFADLIDEYYAGDQYAREGINMTKETDPNFVKWKNWLNDNGIGIYQHCCSGESLSWYRPHQNCMMRSLNSLSFCSVCMEGIIEKIHSMVPSVVSFTPENSGVVDLSDVMNFQLTTVDPVPNTLKITWELNNEVLIRNVNGVTIDDGLLMTGSNQLQVTVEDTTSLLRIDGHESTHFHTISWEIKKTVSGIENSPAHVVEVKLFPNPVTDILSVQLTGGTQKYTIEIRDAVGWEVLTKKVVNKSELMPIDISSLASGVYVVVFSMENGRSITRKIIKE